MRRCVVLLLLLLASCSRTVYVPQKEVEYIERERIDSVYVRDSIYVTLRTANDTVYETRYEYRWRDKLSIKIDTVVKVDSVSYPVEVIRTETRMNGFQRIFFWIGIGFCVAAILYVVAKIYF